MENRLLDRVVERNVSGNSIRIVVTHNPELHELVAGRPHDERPVRKWAQTMRRALIIEAISSDYQCRIVRVSLEFADGRRIDRVKVFAIDNCSRGAL